MEGLLTPVSTSYKPSGPTEDALIKVIRPSSKAVINPEPSQISTAEDALEVLKSEPGFAALSWTLKYLVQDASSGSAPMIRRPSPLAGQIVNAIVTSIIPNYWPVLQEKISPTGKKYSHDGERAMLLTCLKSATGLNAILMRLRALIQQDKEGREESGKNSNKTAIKDYLGVLDALLSGDSFVEALWADLNDLPSTIQKPLWKDIMSLVASGKILNTAAEAWRQVNDTATSVMEILWICEGLEYSRWLGKNIRHWSRNCAKISEDAHEYWAGITSKALKLGYSDAVFQEILAMVSDTDQDRADFALMLTTLSSHDQKLCIDATLKKLAKLFTAATDAAYTPEWPSRDSGLVAGAAAYLNVIIDGKTRRNLLLVSWLASLSGAGLGESIALRRVVLAVVAESKSELELAFEKTLQQFGDQLYIKHAPVMQQEVHAQVLLLSAGYIYRISPMKLTMALRAGPYLSSITNHLSSSSPRVRFLGMVVGEALSSLVDKDGQQVNFKVDEMKTSEALWYKSLVHVQDKIGSLENMHTSVNGAASTVKPKTSKQPAQNISQKPAKKNEQSKIISIEELDDDYEEVEDLVAYEKPDSDAEESDEDPTLITRNKPTAPVYIRDLITYMRDMESYDKQKLGLNTAPSLIRRKASFGTEVTSHAEELATIFVGLQDKFDISDFQDLRLQAMIAIVSAAPKTMAPWFSKTFFDGDYSISQRAAILTVLSVSARELGGFAEVDKSLTKVSLGSSSFPSKQLPPKMRAVFDAAEKQQQQLQPSTIDALTTSLSQAMIQPLAASAADAATGPDILKVRTFSSRMQVEARRKAPTTNALAPLAGPCFFFPLTARFSAHLKAYGPGNVIFSPYLLSAFIKTLSLVLHASGAHVSQLSQMTSEYWELLLGVRNQVNGDKSIGEAICVGFLTILEVNGESAGGMRGLVERHGRELMETQRWTDVYFGSLAGGSAEDNKIRSLAAAVLMRISETVDKYRGLVVGEMSGL